MAILEGLIEIDILQIVPKILPCELLSLNNSMLIGICLVHA